MTLPDGTTKNVVVKILQDELKRKKRRLDGVCDDRCDNLTIEVSCEECVVKTQEEVKTLKKCIPLIEEFLEGK